MVGAFVIILKQKIPIDSPCGLVDRFFSDLLKFTLTHALYCAKGGYAHM